MIRRPFGFIALAALMGSGLAQAAPLTLEEAIRRARERHPSAVAAEAAARAAGHRADAARAVARAIEDATC